MDNIRIIERIDKLINEYKEASVKAKYGDLSDLHNDALVENLEVRALAIIESCTAENSAYRKKAYYQDGRNVPIPKLIGILYALKADIEEDVGNLPEINKKAIRFEEQKYNLPKEEFKYEGTKKAKKRFKCFVIMPIGKEGTTEYENNMLVFNEVIKPCVENGSYNVECYHADLITESGDISKQVIDALRNDDIVVADLRRNNLNVIYELGIRHVFGKRSILVCSEQSENFFHTAKYRAVRYHVNGASNQGFYRRITKHIEAIIEKPRKLDNPVSDILGVRIVDILDSKNTNKKRGKKKVFKNRFYVDRIIKGIYSLGEVYNKSNDDVVDLDIVLEYVTKTGDFQMRKAKMINSSEDPMRASPHIVRLIKKNDTKYITDFPRVKTKVIIRGKMADSGENFDEECDILPL